MFSWQRNQLTTSGVSIMKRSCTRSWKNLRLTRLSLAHALIFVRRSSTTALVVISAVPRTAPSR